MSERIAVRVPSRIKPIAIPAACFGIGTPASIMAKDEPQTEAIDEEPLDSRISETTRIVYGNSCFDGSRAVTPFSARKPWPISRRPGPRKIETSPTEKEGKL